MQFCRDIFQQFNHFCRETTVHGFAYLADNKKASERVLWLVFVVMAFASAIVMIDQSFQDAKLNPILTTIETIDVNKVPFPAVTVLPGEYPVLRELDGFFKRMFDYAEFERYNEFDALRNNTLFNRQWGFMTNDIVHKLFKATQEDLNKISDREYRKTFNRYKNIINGFSEDLVAISNKENSQKIFSGLITELKENFFKYKGFSSATRAYFSDVIEPFVNNAKFDLNLTQQDKNLCS